MKFLYDIGLRTDKRSKRENPVIRALSDKIGGRRVFYRHITAPVFCFHTTGSTFLINLKFNSAAPATTTTEAEEEDDDKDLLVLLLAMQAMNPASPMNAQSMLPLLLMDSDATNKELIMFMSMMNNQVC